MISFITSIVILKHCAVQLCVLYHWVNTDLFPPNPNYHATGPEGNNHIEDPGVDGRIILRWIIRKWDVRAWSESSWLRIGHRLRVLINSVMNLRVP
jgi:hypothetical protein